MDKTEALLQHFREMAVWMEIHAGEYDRGHAAHFTGLTEDSADFAAGLRHKSGNMLAVIACFNRMKARGG